MADQRCSKNGRNCTKHNQPRTVQPNGFRSFFNTRLCGGHRMPFPFFQRSAKHNGSCFSTWDRCLVRPFQFLSAWRFDISHRQPQPSSAMGRQRVIRTAIKTRNAALYKEVVETYVLLHLPERASCMIGLNTQPVLRCPTRPLCYSIRLQRNLISAAHRAALHFVATRMRPKSILHAFGALGVTADAIGHQQGDPVDIGFHPEGAIQICLNGAEMRNWPEIVTPTMCPRHSNSGLNCVGAQECPHQCRQEIFKATWLDPCAISKPAKHRPSAPERLRLQRRHTNLCGEFHSVRRAGLAPMKYRYRPWACISRIKPHR